MQVLLRSVTSSLRPRLATHNGFCASFARGFSTSEDSHDDFKPIRNTNPIDYEEVKKTIENDINSHNIFLYMKGIPEAPQCGFSNHVVKILDVLGVQYGSRNVLENEFIREGIKKYSHWPTIPQLYVKGEFVGGCDIVNTMYQEGELKKMLVDDLKEEN